MIDEKKLARTLDNNFYLWIFFVIVAAVAVVNYIHKGQPNYLKANQKYYEIPLVAPNGRVTDTLVIVSIDMKTALLRKK